MADAENSLIKLGAFWKNKSGEGYSGSCYVAELKKFIDENEKDGKIRIAVFKNGFKVEDKHPDLVFYGSKEQRPVAHVAKGSKPKQKPKDDTDIPF